ncbi:MAG: cytidine deaminase [Acidobacteria bacterium]|nr:cytidine deaminase [Acidobacteriota bacterium]
MTDQQLIAEAHKALQFAVAPYSRFRVGAALLGGDGKVYRGCNIENSTYGLTVCAERVAIFKALSEGVRKFRKIAVASSSEKGASPCGSCRQLLWEFCGDIPVLVATPSGKTSKYRVQKLLPHPFDSATLKK